MNKVISSSGRIFLEPNFLWLFYLSGRESIHLECDVICIVTTYKSMLGLSLQGSNIDLVVGSVG